MHVLLPLSFNPNALFEFSDKLQKLLFDVNINLKNKGLHQRETVQP